MSKISTYKYVISRRVIQIGILCLFIVGNYGGFTLLNGNYSSALVLETIPLADPFAVLQIFASGAVAGFDIVIGGIVILLLYGLIAGRMFCSWVCPVNIISDSAASIHKKFGLKPSLKFSRKTRYGVLALSFILSTILGYAAFEAISPIGIIQRALIFGAGSGLLVASIIFFFELAVTSYGWCGHLCPLGAFYSVTGNFALLKVSFNNDACSSCMKCFTVCPEKQVLSIVTKESGIIKSSECTNCCRCVDVCDDKALRLSTKFKKP